MTISLSVLLFIQTAAGTNVELLQSISRSYVGKVIILREFLSGSHISFDADGAYIGGAKRGIWTRDGSLLIDQVKIFNDRLELTGRRIVRKFNPAVNRLEALTTPESVRLDFRRDQGKSVESAIAAAFIQENELPTHVPAYWRQFLSNGVLESGVGVPYILDEETKQTVARVDMRNPVHPDVLRRVEPDYPELAKRYGGTGTSIVRAIISENGVPRVTDIVSALGLGLDEAAVDAVRQWRFRMPVVNGMPARMYADIEINFNVAR
jgi:TonB family protein